MIQAKGARLMIRDSEGGEWQEVPGAAGLDVATDDAPPPEGLRAPVGSVSFEMHMEDETGSMARLWESMELRDFAPCLPEPYRSAMLRRADTLVEARGGRA